MPILRGKEMNKNVIIGILVLVLCGISGLAGWTLAKRASDRGVIKQQRSDAKEVLKHADVKETAKQKVETIIRTRIRTIVDPSGCLDTDSPDAYLDSLFDADREAKSGFD